MGPLAGKRSGMAGCACAGLSLACVLLLMPIPTFLPVLPELVGHCQGDHEGRPYISGKVGITCRGDPRGRPACNTRRGPCGYISGKVGITCKGDPRGRPACNNLTHTLVVALLATISRTSW